MAGCTVSGVGRAFSRILVASLVVSFSEMHLLWMRAMIVTILSETLKNY